MSLASFISSLTGRENAVSKATPMPVEPLGTPSVARQVAAGAAAGSQALTTTCTRASIYARGGAIRYALTGTADANSHYIGDGERLDINVPTGTTLSAIRAAGVDATLEISELT